MEETGASSCPEEDSWDTYSCDRFFSMFFERVEQGSTSRLRGTILQKAVILDATRSFTKNILVLEDCCVNKQHTE
jgi:hypothetical protein